MKLRRTLGFISLLAIAASTVVVGATPAGAQSCVKIDIASSPEKLTLLTDLAKSFERSDSAQVNGRCINAVVARVSSGAGEQLLAGGWPKPKVNYTLSLHDALPI